jgi:tRNA pseudouridine55 synthase
VSGPWDGLLLVDKPAGPTSHDVVAHVRSALPASRVGHTGTLDPQATGLLLLVLGRATRLARFLPDGPKTYEGSLVLGLTTSTDDVHGEPLRRHDGPLPRAADVLAAAEALLGRQRQRPPDVSARRVGGVRLYRAARRGQPIAAPPTEIVIDAFRIAPGGRPDVWSYTMVVSAGTYVRAVVRDLGASLGCGAAVGSLRRTAIGPLAVEDAMRWPEVAPSLRDAARARLVPLEAMPLALARLTLTDADDLRRFGGGAACSSPRGCDQPGLVAVLHPSGRMLGVGLVEGDRIRPRVVLADLA